MVFSSITFLFVFLPLFLLGYYLLHPVLRNIFLLAASLLFYWWGEPRFLIVMLLSISANYLFGLLLSILTRHVVLKKVLLAVAVGLNIALLFYYKYLDFAIGTINAIVPGLAISAKNIALPIGISFFTFQGLSYVVDVYRGEVKAQKNPLIIAMYISMFPQLIAGPIVRYAEIEDRISCRSVTLNSFYEGVVRFTAGLAKKTLIANTLALQVDRVFEQDVSNLAWGATWIGMVFYTLQIYYDFSGYSDMAIGLGRMIGFQFPENFNLPYMSGSATEFWRRWHISLSSFFRDYVYIPIGGNRRGNVYFHLILVFFLTGLWHGASWNFVVWGLWHGVFLMLERTRRVSTGGGHLCSKNGNGQESFLFLKKLLCHVYTMLIVMIGWVFFRASTLGYALDYLKVMFGLRHNRLTYYGTGYYLGAYTVFIGLLGVLFSTDIPGRIVSRLKKQESCRPIYLFFRMVVFATLLLICVIQVLSSTYNPFIYFRF